MTVRRFARRSFLQSALAISALPCFPRLFPLQAITGAGPGTEAFTVAPGANRPYKSIPLRGYSVSVKVSGEDNGGRFALFEVPAAPDSGPPLHMHHIENECFYVVKGQLNVRVGSESIMVDAGGSVYAPKMIPHTWQTVGGKPVRFLSFAQPAGHLEAFLVALSTSLRQDTPDPASIKALFEKYDMEVVGPPLPGNGPNIQTTG
jgi:mannose-6-phosphate isomerase-like protein (cupin superfamily)